MSREAFIETSSTYIHVDPVNWARRPEATCCFDHFQAGMKTDQWRLEDCWHLLTVLLFWYFMLNWLNNACMCRKASIFWIGTGLGGCPAEGWSWSAMAAEGVGGGGTLNFLVSWWNCLVFWCENDSKWSRTSRSQDKKLTLEPVHRALIHIISSPLELHWFPMNQIQVWVCEFVFLLCLRPWLKRSKLLRRCDLFFSPTFRIMRGNVFTFLSFLFLCKVERNGDRRVTTAYQVYQLTLKGMSQLSTCCYTVIPKASFHILVTWKEHESC